MRLAWSLLFSLVLVLAGVPALPSVAAESFHGEGHLASFLGCTSLWTLDGHAYALDDAGGFHDGDCVSVSGDLHPPSACGECVYIDGCVTVSTIAPLPPNFDQCGTLVVVGPFAKDCLALQTDDGLHYLLDDYGAFGAGDRVAVRGWRDPTCGMMCIAAACVMRNGIAPCSASAVPPAPPG